MNKKLIIFFLVVFAVIGTVSLAIYKVNNPKSIAPTNTLKNNDNQTNSTINDVGIKFENEVQHKAFRTEDEMIAYAKKVNTIENIGEATNFIKTFLNDCKQNSPNTLIGYYYPQIRDSVLQNNNFPIIDKTNTFAPIIENITVNEIKDENASNVYNVSYDVALIDKQNNEPYLRYKAQDKMYLVKEFENIYIVQMEHTTTDIKQL